MVHDFNNIVPYIDSISMMILFLIQIEVGVWLIENTINFWLIIFDKLKHFILIIWDEGYRAHILGWRNFSW